MYSPYLCVCELIRVFSSLLPPHWSILSHCFPSLAQSPTASKTLLDSRGEAGMNQWKASMSTSLSARYSESYPLLSACHEQQRPHQQHQKKSLPCEYATLRYGVYFTRKVLVSVLLAVEMRYHSGSQRRAKQNHGHVFTFGQVDTIALFAPEEQKKGQLARRARGPTTNHERLKSHSYRACTSKAQNDLDEPGTGAAECLWTSRVCA